MLTEGYTEHGIPADQLYQALKRAQFESNLKELYGI
jgi:hypothetical protein